MATTENFDDWFRDLDGDAQAEIIAKVELLKLLGPRLSRPHADTLKGSKHANMKDLRADTARHVMRIRLRSILNGTPFCWWLATRQG